MKEFKNQKSSVIKNLLRSAYYNSKVTKYVNGMLNPSTNPKLFESPTTIPLKLSASQSD